MIIRRVVAVEVVVAIHGICGRSLGKRLVTLVRVRLLLVLRRASRQAAGVAEAASAANRPNEVDPEED